MKDSINKSVVRIFAEIISVNPLIPFNNLQPSRSQGTGFFFNNDGYILTCSHVVENSINIIIDIPNISTEKIKCELIYIVPEFDIALIKTINYKNDYYVELGDSEDIKISDNVFAVGFPKSINRSGSNNIKYTLGIISGHQEGLIQTDTAINSGNSGGPLFKDNKVIGINSRKLVGDNVSNIGYSVPINYYKILKQNNSKILNRPKLNCVINNTDKNLCKILSNGIEGVLISKIYKNSILDKENILLTKIDKYNIDHFGYTNKRWLGEKIHLKNILNFYNDNIKINIEYYYNLKLYKKKIKLESSRDIISNIYSNYEKIDFLIIGGAVLMNLNLHHIEALKLNLYNNFFYKENVITSWILPNSYFNILNNIQMGTIITEINDIKVNNLNDIRKVCKKTYKINNKKVIKIKNENNNITIIDFENIKKNNIILSKIYNFDKKYII